MLDGKEQNRFNEKSLFWLESESKVKINKWEINDQYDFLDPQHSGYRRFRNPIIHRRLIFFDKQEKYWIAKDIMTGKGFYQYGIKMKATVVRYSIESYAPTIFCNVIYPYEKEIDIKEVLDKVQE
ncbi:MAG TPA: hypothetical protein ENH85_14210 [Candidatus Scalindua sp.]|nr:hypothetical protein [Candidatus Scalindua sp.]